ncbi:NAD(+) ADP-ribosyltransferase [Plasmodiophora brassicae]
MSRTRHAECGMPRIIFSEVTSAVRFMLRRSTRIANQANHRANVPPPPPTVKKVTKQRQRASRARVYGPGVPVDVVFGAIAGPGAIVYENDDGTPYDAALCYVDMTSDKFYIIQIVNQGGKFYFFNRWGRTGTKGQNQVSGPFSAPDEAVSLFEKKFLDKTGHNWKEVCDRKGFAQIPGKYCLLASNPAAAVAASRQGGVQWQYEVTDNVDGKVNGWYNYDAEGNDVVEELHAALYGNQNLSAILTHRIVASGEYQYAIDLGNGTQRNTTTGKVRNIRRLASPSNNHP